MAQQIVIEVPGTKISELEKASSVSRNDITPVVQADETKQAEIGQIADFVKSELGSAAFKDETAFVTPAALEEVSASSQSRDDAQNERIDAAEHGLVSIGSGADASFGTYAEMLAYVPPKANVSVRNNDPDPALRGVYIWTGTQYIDGYDPLDKSIEYTNEKFDQIPKAVSLSTNKPVCELKDKIGNVVAWFTVDSLLRIFGLDGSVQEEILLSKENINLLSQRISETSDLLLLSVRDKNGNVVAFMDNNSALHVDELYIKDQSISELIQSTKQAEKNSALTYQNALINRYAARSEFTSVMTLEESAGLRNRMIAGVKIPSGLFLVWHQQTKAEYDGDGSGSAFWCGFADIDSNFKITIRDKKLFIYPDTDAGIIKHPHLGRTTDNRLILVYEKSIGSVEKTPENPVDYIKHVRYSSDEGATWTDPVALTYTNSPPTNNLKALGTTCEVLKLSTGRLIVPLYSLSGHSGCIYSDNDGSTWTYSSRWVLDSNWGLEPSITVDSNNDLIMSMRPVNSGSMFVAFAKSTDHGDTWELIHKNRVVSVQNQSHLSYDKSIGVHFISHDINPENKRTNFRISLSYDDGYTFPLSYAPFSESKFVGYTQIVKWTEGVYLLLMEYNDVWNGVNVNEQVGIQLFTAKEVFNNVSRN
ncbi:sialidase family protein [Acinetobacter baumannii]|uniref:sialidase family protein n=1 Tax=Acinetobacter baumannii TaxID=470 RepID=UPI0023420A35|nr:glycoside hydrolase [Acinetobacter baumannii]